MAAKFAYGADDVARCCFKNHPAPQVHCSCGFHAVDPGYDLRMLGGLVTLDVELMGRVIVHDKGYRAERQRVLCVTLRKPRLCQPSGNRVCSGSPTLYFLSLASVGLGLLTRCPTHAPLGLGPLVLPDLASMLGTEFRWGA